MFNKPPSGLEDHLGYWLHCLSNYVSESFATKLEKYDVSVAQWVVLRSLYDSGSINLNEAAALVGVNKSSLSRMVERLVQKNLITRITGTDRRSLKLALTAEGKKLVPKLAKLADRNDNEFFQTLAPIRRQQFLADIKQLLAANNWQIKTRGKDRLN